MRNIPFFLLIALIASCGGSSNKTESSQTARSQSYLEKGSGIANATQAELLKVVSGAMSSGGPGYAIEFCNLEALQLKDSLSREYNCRIQRLAVRNRNPLSYPTTRTERDQLEAYQRAHQNGEPLEPKVHLFEDRAEYYQPIVIPTGVCLVCHGDPETQIAEETLSRINELYPEDRATGFALNDFRGAWKITFPN